MSQKITEYMADMSEEDQDLLVEVVRRCRLIKAQDDSIFLALAESTIESAPPYVKALPKIVFDLILGMGYDLGRAVQEIRQEEK